ncbi:ankyrin repeat domain-containing protein [Paenibacillus ehimensis]|uniref:ankyrin repeat domain-containing protein n=1 Tax=Paenibacillus ehimensis TaxID=79264 RepID=UPI002482F5C9|nr:ankyrin repeat domain-containing protein [Paenibacillus ehimensis]MEC0208863.1 ankyrin repeat domain-containing protein [Paenibacillus ehimensis]
MPKIKKEEQSLYRTGKFAEMAGVTTRTLRYYERMGLLKPGHRSESGQRLYSKEDFVRLQQIVTLKFVGFSLKQIRRIVENKDIQLSALLAMQREWIERKIWNLQLAVQAIRKAELAVEEGMGPYVDNLQQIIRVMEMQTNRDWADEFLQAALEGNEATARAILAAHPGLTKTSIYTAAAAGDADAVAAHLKRNPASAVKPGGPFQAEPLLYLCFSWLLRDAEKSRSFAQAAQMLLAGGANPNAFMVDPDDPYERKLPVLYGALGMAGHMEVGRALLAAGAEPNDGETLYHAAELSRNDCLDLLHEYGVDVNATPALFRKLDYDDEAGVRWFLEHGADLALTLGEQRNTALHWAVYRGRSQAIVELLLKHGAEVNARRTDGKTAYVLAVRFGETSTAALLLRHGAIREAGSIDQFLGACAAADEQRIRAMLEEDPALLSALTADDREMLLEFAERGRADAVRLMLEAGFDKETSREEGTALHIAAWFGHLDTVRVLLAGGASVSVQNGYGGTPLESAIHGSMHCNGSHPMQHAAVVEALIQAGAVVPAKAEGSRDVYEILLMHGASIM